MELVTFSVEKYRSITRANKIKLKRSTILVGPNNEGKSNILRALVTAMNVLTRSGMPYFRRGPQRGTATYFSSRPFYNWETDYPLHLQKKSPNGQSEMILEFSLTPEEIVEFRKEIKSSLNGTLPIKIALGPREVEVSVVKKGKGAKSLSDKSIKIANFVAERLDFEHIQAVRTAHSAERIVDDMVERELKQLEKDVEYIAALKKIEDIQRPLLEQLSNSIKVTLVQFLPAIRDVQVQIQSSERTRALRRSCEIIVDDGTPTRLEYKGDGVQSLAALGIMRHASERGARGRNLVIAIEEPESHLHPTAIHRLRQVVTELSEKHQIVLTTHCPLFVDRTNVQSNVIVNKKTARPAKTISEIRDILGVKASDNLRHAQLVLLVEGEGDKTIMKALLPMESSFLASALKNGTIAIDSLSGGSNLAYKISLVSEALCATHCFLDDDKAARDGFEKALEQGLVTYFDANFATCDGMSEAEIEDLLKPSIYKDLVKNAYGVSLDSGKFKTSKKWSERMRDVFKQQGKPWTDSVEKDVKERIAELVVQTPDQSLNHSRQSPFISLVTALEDKLGKTRSSE